jgi:multidrug resistance efflux pump
MSTTYGTAVQREETTTLPPMPAAAPAPAPPAPRNRLRRTLLFLRTTIVVLILIAAAAGGGWYVWRDRIADQAFVHAGTAVLMAPPISVGAADAAVVTRMLVSERQSVTAGATLATITVTADGRGAPRVQQLHTPAAGIVTAINVPPGQIARAGEPIVTLYDPAKLAFQVDVPLATLRKLRLGMTAYVTGPGLSGRIATTLQQVQPRVATGQPAATSDALTVILRPDPADLTTVRTLVPGLQFGVVVDTTTAVGSTPAVNSA